jgi:hypothetical protein
VKFNHVLFSVLTLFLLVQSPAQAQQHGARSLDYSRLFRTHFYRGPVIYSFGAGLGASRGDFCGRPSCNFWGRYVSLGLAYPIQPGISLGGDLEYFRLSATESRPHEPWARNISFRGENVALTGYLRLNLRRDPRQFPGDVRAQTPIFLPYAKVGLGGLLFHPVLYEGRGRYQEGVRVIETPVAYPDMALVGSFGGGMSIRLSREIALNPEMMYHLTSTDYLDGVKNHPSHKRKDHYGIASVKVQYVPSRYRFTRITPI